MTVAPEQNEPTDSVPDPDQTAILAFDAWNVAMDYRLTWAELGEAQKNAWRSVADRIG